MNDIDYKVKYEALRKVVLEQLDLLRPWYIDGYGCGSNVAIKALRRIHEEVRR